MTISAASSGPCDHGKTCAEGATALESTGGAWHFPDSWCLPPLWLAICLIVQIGCQSRHVSTVPMPTVQLIAGQTMGTTYSVKVIGLDNHLPSAENLKQQIDSRIAGINQSMSTYIPDSELSLFNKSDGVTPIKVSAGLAKVLTESLRLGAISAGKLDVTVGPLVNLWGFGPDYRVEKKPTEEELTIAKNRIGLENVVFVNRMLSKKIPDLYIDLSTIAKGYGVDVVADLIEANGINNYLVEIGGEMRVKGFKANGTLWHVAIEKPINSERSVHQIIVPKDNAVATSGDYRNYIEVDGQRFSHIIDPDTGYPINHKLVSVTVIHPSSMTADGLSTTLMVMGAEQGLAFAEANDIAAMLIVKTDNGFEEINTVKFMPFLK